MSVTQLPEKQIRLGVDLGGTKIELIALSGKGDELWRKRVDTPRNDYDETVWAIAGLVKNAENDLSLKGSVGIGIPGAISYKTGLIKNANSTWLNGHKLDEDLAMALDRPVRLANDANCFAVSEANDGAAIGHKIVFGVILGTGVGGGIAIEGKPVAGRNSIAGEWGHNSLPRPTHDEIPGPACYCGQSGCIEKWLSGPGMEAEFEQVTHISMSSRDIVAAAENGYARAMAALDRYVDRLARSLSMVINILDPDAIVLGGGMSNLALLYERLPDQLQKWCFSDGIDTPVLQAVHGDSSGVRGAAWLWD